jgi:hypothetical protein
MNVKRGKARHPIQPLIVAPDGFTRFKSNKVVVALLDRAKQGIRTDLNDLACLGLPNDDFEQFAQLIGYSLSGWGSLSYVSDRAYAAANAQPVYQKQAAYDR